MIQIVFKMESRSRGTVYLLFFRGGLFTMIARLSQLFEFYWASRLAWLVNCCNCFFLSFLFFSFFQYTFSLSCACVHSQQQRLYQLFFSIGPLQAMDNTILIQLSRLSKLYVSKCSDHQRSLLTVWETLLEDELFWKRSYRIASYYRYNSRYSFFLRRQAYVNIPVIHLNYNCYLDKEGQCNRFNIILVYNLYPRYSAESISFHRCLSDLFIYYGALNSIFTSKGSSWGFCWSMSLVLCVRKVLQPLSLPLSLFIP